MNAQTLKELAQSSSISLSELRSLRNFCALNDDAGGLFDELSDAELKGLIDRLFDVVLNVPGEGDECVDARCALQCLSNGANRSGRFASVAWRARPLTLWRAMLRDERLRLYSLAALTALVRVDEQVDGGEPHTEDDVEQLHLDLLSLWMTDDERHRSWIAAYFANRLQQEAFMRREFSSFGDYQNVFLSVVNTLLSADDVQRTTSIRPENIRFCLNLLTSCIESIGDDPSTADNADDRLLLLLEILSSAAIIRPAFDQVLHSGTDLAAIERAVAVLRSVVRSEMEGSSSSEEQRADRLVARWRTDPSRRSEVKQASLQLIGHLCCENAANQRRAGDLDALSLALHCARLQQPDRPFQVQWAVLAVRHLCLNCPENQERLFAVDRVPSTVIDSDRLLESLGLRAVVDADTGQVRLAPLNPPQHQQNHQAPPS